MSGRTRTRIGLALVVLGALVLPFAIAGLWVRRTVVSTDGYVAAVAPLAHDAAVQRAIVARSTRAIDRAIDRLPLPSGGIAGRVADESRSALRRAAETGATKVVESDQFAERWEQVNRLAHDEVVDWFRGTSPRVRADVDDDSLVISLQPLVDSITERASNIGIPGFDGGVLHDVAPELTIVDGPLVDPVATLVRVLDRFAFVFTVLSLVAFGAGIALARDRRLTAAVAGLATVVVTALALVGLWFGRHTFVEWIESTSVSVPASKAFFDALAHGLRRALLVSLVVGAAAALAGHLARGRRRRAPAGEADRAEGVTVAQPGQSG